MGAARASCQLLGCEWTQEWSTRDAAGCAGTWHVYQDHYETWVGLFGATEPRDPRPEEAGERYG